MGQEQVCENGLITLKSSSAKYTKQNVKDLS